MSQVKAAARPGPGMREFIVMMAALMAANALAIDAMLPALPAIGDTLGVREANDRQLVVTAYLIGFGLAQIVYGPLSDRFGRTTMLLWCMGLYVVFGLACALSGSFALLIGARVLQGGAAAATRVLSIAIVRDRYSGDAMSRVMSLVSIVFMLVPIVAPTVGQAILTFADWRFIFLFLAVYGALLLAWLWLRLPETLPPEARQPLSFAQVKRATMLTLTNRLSIGNTVAITLVFGGLFAFINSIQQIVFDVFERPDLLGLVFASIGLFLAGSSWLNSRIVERHGSRRVGLVGTTMFVTVSMAHLAVAYFVGEDLFVFIALQALTMASFGMIGANLGTLAMEPLGHIAGTAAAVQGLISTVGGALIGFLIGQAFDGTTIPFLTGLSLCSLAGLAVAWWANPRPGRRRR